MTIDQAATWLALMGVLSTILMVFEDGTDVPFGRMGLTAGILLSAAFLFLTAHVRLI